MMLQLGDLVFEGLFLPGIFQETRRWDWAENKVLDTKPHLQKTGKGLLEISLAVQLSAVYGDPENQLDELYKHADRDTTLPLILGTGKVVGEFCILEIQTNWKRARPDGKLLAAEVTIRLKEYR